MPVRGISKLILVVCSLILTTAPARAGELEERQQITSSAAEMFRAGQYEALDREASQYAESAARTSSGLWKQSIFFAGLEQVITGAKYREKSLVAVEQQFLDWAQRNPNSSSAHVGYASALVAHAWFYRGEGSARSVRQQDWAPFRAYLEKARRYLMKHAEVAETDPIWYTKMLAIARAQGWSDNDFMNLVSEGLAVHPYFYPIYFSAIQNLLPKWGGSLEEIEDFALAAVKYTEEEEGQGMYARIYWYVSQTEYGRGLFTRSKVDWPSMSASIDDVMARFPDQWNINNFARFACLAEDREKTRQLIALVQEPPMAEAWTRLKPTFEQCRDWANG
jgi:hypothetical protein